MLRNGRYKSQRNFKKYITAYMAWIAKAYGS